MITLSPLKGMEQVTSDAIQETLKSFLRLSVDERGRFIDYVTEHSLIIDTEAIADVKFANGYTCPHCHAKGKGVTRYGRTKKGKPRYMCKHCGRSFSATTGSVMYNSKLSVEKWREFTTYFLHGFTVRKTADLIGVSPNTAFLWRHKICDSLNEILKGVKLEGIVEADETYFRVSHKGGDIKTRELLGSDTPLPEKRRKRGLSKEQVCVPCAVNRGGQSVARIAEVGRGSYAAIEAVLSEHIVTGSTICADGAQVYNMLAAGHGLTRVRVNARCPKKGCYSILHVNAYHSGLKQFIRQFHGVSTKHLNNYLMWFNFATYAKETHTEKKRLIMRHIMTANSYTRRIDVPDRPAIPNIFGTDDSETRLAGIVSVEDD